MYTILLCCLLGQQPAQPAQRELTPVEGLIWAGQHFPGAQVCQSQWSPRLAQLATWGAYTCAVQGHGGHPTFNQAFQIMSQEGYRNASEINAESWPWQANAAAKDLGWEMFKCWRQSSGHWRTAGTRHRFYGAGMARSARGIWYATILVSD